MEGDSCYKNYCGLSTAEIPLVGRPGKMASALPLLNNGWREGRREGKRDGWGGGPVDVYLTLIILLTLVVDLFCLLQVCLSILNTWHGRPEEKWNPQTSSFLQVRQKSAGLYHHHPFMGQLFISFCCENQRQSHMSLGMADHQPVSIWQQG